MKMSKKPSRLSIRATSEDLAALRKAMTYELQPITSKPFDPRPQTHSTTAAFHGSPHEVDKFSTQKIGTGEGARPTAEGCISPRARRWESAGGVCSIAQCAGGGGRSGRINKPR
jgi:hypothetical protein